MCDSVFDTNGIYIIINSLITHVPSLVPNIVPHFSAHCVISGCFRHVAFSLESAGAAVMSLFHFETMAPSGAVFFHESHINGSSGYCSMSVGSSSIFVNFWSERRDGGLCFCEFYVCLTELQCEVGNRFLSYFQSWCDPIGLQWQYLPGHDYYPVSFPLTLRRLPNFGC